MHPPPTIQRRVEPPVGIAPYAMVTVRAAPEAGMSEIRPLIEQWTGAGVEYARSWPSFAAAHFLVGGDDRAFFDPDFVYCGRHRWIAIILEAPGEMHMYAGLCARAGEALPEVATVAERTSTLIQILTECRLHRGSRRIHLRVSGSMYMRGNPTGYEYQPPTRYLATCRDADTIREALPLFVASYGGLFASGPVARLPLSSYAITLLVGVLAYCFLAWMRWIAAAGGQSSWISTGWPR